ncbi:caspase family protein [Emticicia sp. W12TSBA100-4]|uniref:caspase family protein n=1 Tax=Emticicia sp. W12TSBA100-4 TaxID=3160965 RepID=UPI00330590F5
MQKNINKGEAERKALIIGNQNYNFVRKLNNIYNDADSMSVALQAIGFKKPTVVKDTDYASMMDAIDSFVENSHRNDVVFFYFSGHGIGLHNNNWLLPINFDATCLEQVKNRAINVEELRKRIQDKEVRNLFLVLDACRDETITEKCPTKNANPNTKLVDIEANSSGFLQAFATGYGKTSTYKSYFNKNSLYTESLLLYIR